MTQRAGNMNDRITVQRMVAGDDGYGNTSNAWVDHLIVWADVLEGLGRETVATGRIESAKTATIRIRRSADALGITAADRISARGGIWNIRSIVAMGRNREMLELLVEAGVAT